jgi:hypothetical protein
MNQVDECQVVLDVVDIEEEKGEHRRKGVGEGRRPRIAKM